MIIGTRKPLEEIQGMLSGYKKILPPGATPAWRSARWAPEVAEMAAAL
jgi:hypothetical protein